MCRCVPHAVQRIHVVVDGDVTDIVACKGFFQQDTHHKAVSAQPGMVFHKDGRDISRFHLFHHGFVAGAVERDSGIAVVHKKLWVGKAVGIGIFH